VKAAQAIWDRFVAASGGTATPPRLDPARVAPMRLPALARSACRAARPNTCATWRSISCAAARSVALARARRRALIAALVDVKGIGPVDRGDVPDLPRAAPDVLPLDDIGLQKAIALHYFAGRRRARSTLERLGRRWRPYRSVATWYLWRSLDPIPVEY
jgi:DNA-3-methyladenine glycosylase II